MRIINKRTCPCFFPYAGSKRRGVNLEVGGVSPDFPLDRINVSQLKLDLASGYIKLVLSDDDKERLSGNVSNDVLKSSISPDEVGVEAAPAPPSAPAPAPTSAPSADDPTMVITKEGGDVDKVDAVVEEHIARIKMLTPDARADELLKLDPDTAKKVVEALGTADEVPTDEVVKDDEVVEDEVVEDEVVEDEEVEDEEVENDTPEEDVVVDELASEVDLDAYKKWKTPRTIEELNTRGIDFEPAAELKTLKKLLLDDDLSKAAN